MAMDKERLLSYFQDHYLSRQEVLFKLPLNYSIDTFWPELLARRKSQATLLPLNNAAGMPYWYVLTPGMITASERLCEEAISQDKPFDPYRAEMTSAMTEEMFFTSFVEGAQIPLQAAMDFLQRGTEPESIQEQMIWNNRRAWAEMISAIYRPLDERFVKNLAFMLTEEMDGCAMDYRQMDSHPIAAMNAEPYDVLPAYCIPERMNQYYEFLQFGNVHPLIKASAAQAYLLVSRPFPEGNERLSRMISSAVLLRSGYDFFRDISISSVIARESYRYYKSMCEIIRAENGGDLTYFMEYYLELLVRAIDQRNERIHRREQEALARDREMAMTPLAGKTVMITPVPEEIRRIPTIEEVEEEDERRATEQAGTEKPRKNVHMAREGVLINPLPEKEFLKIIDQMKNSPHAGNKPIPGRIRRMIERGLYTFSVSQWATENGIDRKAADVDCRKLYDKGLVQRGTDGTVMTYTLQIRKPEPSPPDGDDKDKSSPDFWDQVGKFEQSNSSNRHKVAEAIRAMISQGQMEFTTQQMCDMTGIDWKHTRSLCDKLVGSEMVININPNTRKAIYRFNLDGPPGKGPQEEDSSSDDPPWDDSPDPTPEFREHIRSLGYDSDNEMDQRIGRFLLKMMEQGIRRFTSQDYGNESGRNKSGVTHDLRKALNLGLIKQFAAPKGGIQHIYEINMTMPDDIRTEELTDLQKSCLTKLYYRMFSKPFTVERAAKILESKGSSASFHLTNFTERGILEAEGIPGRPLSYTFKTTPKDHPECFLKGERTQTIGIRRRVVQQSGMQRAAAV